MPRVVRAQLGVPVSLLNDLQATALGAAWSCPPPRSRWLQAAAAPGDGT